MFTLGLLARGAFKVTENHKSTQERKTAAWREKAPSMLSNFVLPDVSSKALFSSVTVACIMALINTTGAVSFASLVFSGPLSAYLALGVGFFLIGNAISAILVPSLSTYRANIASTRAGQAPIFATIAAAIVVSMPDQPTEAIVASVIAGMLVATLISGLFMLTMGVMRIGSLVRNIPYPVMGGFFAGLGYLTLVGGISVAVGPTASTSQPESFGVFDPWPLLSCAIIFAVALLALERFIKHWSLFTVYMSLAAFIFYAFLYVADIPISQAAASYWLPSLGGEGDKFWPIITLDQIALVDWRVVLAQGAVFAVLAFLSVIMLLLDVSGIEVVANRDLDPNRELRAAGVSNVVAGMCGGALAFQSLTDVAIVQRLGADSILMSSLYAVLCIVVILMGPGSIAFVPNFILGGILIYIGLNMLRKWIIIERSRLSLPDYIVVLTILLGVVFFGVLEGVGIGIALATILFVHRYSQLNIVRSSMIGSEYVTKTDRSLKDQEFLDAHGEALRLFILQGFLFFGTANGLLDQIRAALAGSDQLAAKFVVIDFRRVDAIDSSAANCFAKLMQICVRSNIKLVLCDCGVSIRQSISAAVCQSDLDQEGPVFFSDLEAGMDWCNDTILQDDVAAGVADELDTIGVLKNLFGSGEAAIAIAPLFERIEVAAKTVLFRQNDLGDALYIVVKGSVAIKLKLPNEQSVTVRTMKAGALIGEMALYSGAARSATGEATEDSTLLQLDKTKFQALQITHPILFGEFNKQIISLMVDRLARANREITALSR
jgi:SulP family sulfate permease